MFYVEDQTIYLTRGDTATLAVTLATENGEEYTVGADDILTLTVRKEPKADSPVIFRRSVTGKQEIDILCNVGFESKKVITMAMSCDIMDNGVSYNGGMFGTLPPES